MVFATTKLPATSYPERQRSLREAQREAVLSTKAIESEKQNPKEKQNGTQQEERSGRE